MAKSSAKPRRHGTHWLDEEVREVVAACYQRGEYKRLTRKQEVDFASRFERTPTAVNFLVSQVFRCEVIGSDSKKAKNQLQPQIEQAKVHIELMLCMFCGELLTAHFAECESCDKRACDRCIGFSNSWTCEICAPRESDKLTYAIVSNSTGMVKVGRSKDPETRLKQIATGHPGEMELVRVWPFDCEREIHHSLRQYRATGEWFEGTDEVYKVIGYTSKRSAWGRVKRVFKGWLRSKA